MDESAAWNHMFALFEKRVGVVGDQSRGGCRLGRWVLHVLGRGRFGGVRWVALCGPMVAASGPPVNGLPTRKFHGRGFALNTEFSARYQQRCGHLVR